MRLIDADALVRDHGFFIEDEDGFPTCVVCETDIRHYPTIDAVPVVRCKDCVYNKNGGCTQSEEYDGNYRPDYFCADGERGSDG